METIHHSLPRNSFCCLSFYRALQTPEVMNKGCSPSLEVGRGTTTPHWGGKTASYEMLHRASEVAGCCEHGDEP